MVCMDGFILTHAYEPVDLPSQEAGRRLPAAVRAAPAARPGRAGHDRRDGRARGVHRGPLPDARQAAAGARRHPESSRRSSRRPSDATPAACSARYRTDDAETIVVALGSVIGHDRGRDRRAARAGREDRRGRRSSASAPTRSTRFAKRCSGAERVVVIEKAFAVGAGGIVGQNVRLRSDRLCDPRQRRRRRARRQADHDEVAARPLRRRRSPTGSSPAGCTSSTSSATSSSVSSTRMRGNARPGPHAENIVRDLGIVAGRPH